MAINNRTTDRVVLTPQAFRVSFDLAAPGEFLSTYRLLLNRDKPSRANVLVRTTTRLMQEYMEAQRDLESAQVRKIGGVLGWLKKRHFVARLRARVARLKRTLLDWVSSSLSFFRVAPAIIFDSFGPLPTGFSVEF
ncbi:hypothetical protein [Microbulbifer aggregans]|uniref:hypothetical protein n=1 Tax=Microbulbifer aggregans TaxID=1769779 RepID=UPI001CFC683D|nr:hypothetical protein [Microbulbifer aggregans]